MCDNREEKRQHIDIIESTITRMSENSKQMKEWCIALVTGLVGVNFAIKISWLIIIALIVTILFGCLDTFYLTLERRYRYLYNDAVCIGNEYSISKCFAKIRCFLAKKRNRQKIKYIKSFVFCRKIHLYEMSTKKYEKYVTHCSAFTSKSICLFYGGVSLALVILFIVAVKSSNVDETTKIELSNKQIEFKMKDPLNVNVKEFDSLNINLDKIDSLILKIDELKKMNIRIVDTVTTKSLIKKGK